MAETSTKEEQCNETSETATSGADKNGCRGELESCLEDMGKGCAEAILVLLVGLVIGAIVYMCKGFNYVFVLCTGHDFPILTVLKWCAIVIKWCAIVISIPVGFVLLLFLLLGLCEACEKVYRFARWLIRKVRRLVRKAKRFFHSAPKADSSSQRS